MFANYLKVTLRNMVNNKVYAALNLIGLTIGFTAAILILFWVRNELSFDHFHPEAERVYRITLIDDENPSEGIARVGAPWAPAIAETFPEVEDYVRFRFVGRSLVRRDGLQFYEPEGLYVDPAALSVFNFPLAVGDPSSALTEPNSIILGQKMALKYFASENPIGQQLEVNGTPMQVTGVLQPPAGNSHITFDFLISFETHQAWYKEVWTMQNYHVYLKLREGADPAVLEAAFPAFLAKHMGDRAPQDAHVALQPLTDIHLHSNLAREMQPNGSYFYVMIFMSVSLLILCAAGFNYLNLATARATRRAREIGIRKAIGSSRGQLILQFLGEAIFFAWLAFFFSIGLVELLLPAFETLSGSTLDAVLPSLWQIGGIGIPVVTLIGIAAGLYPALFLTGYQPVSVLRNRLGGNRGGKMVRQALVIAQFSVSIALIVATFFIFQQLDFLKNNRSLGLDKHNKLVIRLSDNELRMRHQVFKSALLGMEAIRSVSACSGLPGGGDWGMTLQFEGLPEGERQGARVMMVDEDYLETMGIDLVAGQALRGGAEQPGAQFMINQAAAKMLGWENPLGKQVGIPIRRNEAGGWDYEYGTVSGVMADFHYRSLHQEILPLVIWYQPENFGYLTLDFSEAADLGEALQSIASAWGKFAPEYPFDYLFLDEVFDRMYRSEQQLSSTFLVFAGLAIFVACLGLLGLAAFAAEQRTREIGIRKVLGASVASIVTLLSTEFSRWVIIANVFAWPLAYLVISSWLQNFHYRIEIDFLYFPLAGIASLAIAWLTVALQALRAAMASPAATLHHD